METHHGNLQEILILLVAAVFIVASFKKLNLSPVLGYLVAGAAIGQHGLGFITDVRETNSIAEFGVVFLLFYIGLTLTFERLVSLRKHVFGFGTSQVIITSVMIAAIAFYGFAMDPSASIIIGGALAFSSTAIVLQVLAERGKQATQVGRLSLAVLILQDLAVVPLLVLVPLLQTESANIGIAILDALTKAAIALVVIFIIGRILFRPLFRLIGSLRSQELFSATTVLIVLGAAWATEHAGLTLALGAFVAGLMLAETEFRHQVEADIMPYKGLLMGLFFMTVGMSINIEMLINKMPTVIILAISLIALKALIIVALCHFFKFKTGTSIYSGLMLSQGGEFGFVLFGIATQVGIIPQETGQILLIVISLTMAVTPLLAAFGERAESKMDKQKILGVKEAEKECIDLENHVIIAGFGRMGRTVAKLLSTENINYTALDTNPRAVYTGNMKDLPVYYGDASRIDVLHSVGIDRAKAVIITVNNKEMAFRALATIRREFPEMPVIIRAKDIDSLRKLEQSGATMVVPEIYETSLQLGAAVLKYLGIPDHEIHRVVRFFRAEDYAAAKEVIEVKN